MDIRMTDDRFHLAGLDVGQRFGSGVLEVVQVPTSKSVVLRRPAPGGR